MFPQAVAYEYNSVFSKVLKEKMEQYSSPDMDRVAKVRQPGCRNSQGRSWVTRGSRPLNPLLCSLYPGSWPRYIHRMPVNI